MQDLSQLPDNTPVIIGAASFQQHNEDPLQCLEAWQLMAEAIRLAAVDAVQDDNNKNALIASINSITVPQGMWPYKNPAALIAQELGASKALSAYTTIGIPQLTLLSEACQAIISGEQEIAVITGGEAKYRSLMAQIHGVELSDANDEGAVPDKSIVSDDALWSELESQRGLVMPTDFYAIMESSMRKAEGLDIESHRTKISELYQRFSQIAAANPDAWYQQEFTVEQIRDPIDKNAMLAFPYTKKHNTQWNVNQAAAIIVCSFGKAKVLGVSVEKMVFPLANTQSCHTVAVSQREILHSHQGTKLAAQRLFEMSGLRPEQVDHVELYSCFPVAVRSFALDSGLGLERDLTVTGGMPFAGGPLNNFTLQGLVKLTQILRGDPGSIGLISNISGMISKQSFALLSTQAPANGWQYEDVSEQTANSYPPVETDIDYVGPVVVVGYTVVFNKQQMSHAVLVCDTPAGKRTVGQSSDMTLMEQMTKKEFVGETIHINEQGQVSLLA